MSEQSTEQVLRGALEGLVGQFHQPNLDGVWCIPVCRSTDAALPVTTGCHHALAKARAALALPAGEPRPELAPLTEERVEELAQSLRRAQLLARHAVPSAWGMVLPEQQEHWRCAARILLPNHPELHRVADVSPSVAAKAVQDLAEVLAVMRSWSLGRPHVSGAGFYSCSITPDYKAVDLLVEKIAAVQKTLREVRDAAPAEPKAAVQRMLDEEIKLVERLVKGAEGGIIQNIADSYETLENAGALIEYRARVAQMQRLKDKIVAL